MNQDKIWKQKIAILHIAEQKLNEGVEKKLLSKKEEKIIKEKIKKSWNEVCEINPHKNILVEKSFKLNF